VVAGVAASGINSLVYYSWNTFYQDAIKTPILFFIFPFTGLALSYFLIHLLAWYRTPKSSFHTILEVFHLTPTGMMPREAVVKTASGVATSIFGGSAGPEGPTTVISGGFSTWLSKFMKIRMDSSRALMIGVAAGFSASFKTPLTGLLFALELPYRRDLEKETFIEAAIASSTAYLVAVAIGAPSLLPGLQLELSALPIIWLPIAMGFGLATGGIVFLFTQIYSIGEKLAKQIILRGGYPLMLLAGGFLLGGIDYVCPQAVGPGYQMVPLLMGGSLMALAVVLLLRSVSTSVTMSFGGTGGLFLPTLLVGGAWGALMGNLLMPSMTPVFVLMGMAAFSAGVHKMMLTPIVFMAELFGAQTIIPIILATVVCFFVSGAYSFYPIQPINKLSKEELALERFYYKVMRSRPKELEKLFAGDIMSRNPISLGSEMSIREAMDAFGKTSFRIMPVVNPDRTVVGYVTLEDLAFLTKTVLDKPLSTAELRTPLTFGEGERVVNVMEKMIVKEVDHCFIVDAEGRLTGIISTIDVTRLLMRYYTQT
jgi:CIC family chloride channel protein